MASCQRDETYLFDTEVELTALHKEGYVFDYWLEGEVQYNSDPLRAIVAAQDVYTTAVFRPGIPLSVVTAYDQYSGSGMWVEDDSVGEVHFTPDPPGDPKDGARRSETYWPDQAVSVAPFPDMGFAFHHWEEGGSILEDDNHTYSLVLEEPRCLTAVFYPGHTLMAAIGIYDVYSPYELNESVGDIVITPDYAGGSDDGLVQTEHYLDGTEVTLLAEPGAGFQFGGWQGSVSGYVNPVSVTMNDDQTATALFYALDGTTYTLTTAVADAGAGVVYPASGNRFGEGKLVAPLAVPTTPGWRFDHWSGAVSTTTNPTLLVMDADLSITAHFVETRILETGTLGGGDVEPSPGEHVYDLGTTVPVSATPWDETWRFDHWVGNVAEAQSVSTTVTLNSDEAVQAMFMRRYLLDTEYVGIGSVTPADGRYDDGTTVTITATETDQDWLFKRWEGDVADPESATTTVVMDEDQTVTAVFVTTYTLTLNTASGGSVAREPAGTGSLPTLTYDSDVTVELTANPDTGYRFDAWQGDLAGSVNPEYLLMDGDKTVTPVFVETADLTPQFEGDGAILADGVPVEELTAFDKDTTLQLEAVPDEGWRFDHWEGALSGSTNPESLAMDADKTVKAVFIKTYQLEVIKFAGGNVDPDEGIYTYDVGTQVTCTATAGNGFRFQRWEGHVSGEDDTVTVTMDADKTVAARFIARVQLTMAKQGQGTISPAEGTDTYDFQTLVNINAEPASGWMFMHWLSDGVEDPLNGWTEPEASVVADMPPPTKEWKTVTAVFEEERLLTTAVEGPPGCGTVSPPTAIYPDDTWVTVTATANEGYTFERWSGSLMGYTNPASVLMNADVYATAVFEEEIVQTYTLTVEQSGQGEVSPEIGTHTYNEGSLVSLKVLDRGAGYTFDHWECNGAFLTDHEWAFVIMDTDKLLRAVFSPKQMFRLTVCIEGRGTTQPTPGFHTFTRVEIVPLNAVPLDGWVFDHWERDGEIYSSWPDTFLEVSRDMTVKAVFKGCSVNKYWLRSTITPAESGRIDAYAWIAAPGGSQSQEKVQLPSQLAPGTVVWLWAKANPPYRFGWWSDDASGASTYAAVTMTRNKDITANFFDASITGIEPRMIGEGTISLNPPAEDYECSGTNYPLGEDVTITPVPADGWRVSSLTIDGVTCQHLPHELTISGRHLVTAVFKGACTFRWTTDGNGTVSPRSERVYAEDRKIEVTAEPATGYVFDEWSGDLSGWENPTELVMSGNKDVHATFAPANTYRLATYVTDHPILQTDKGGAVAVVPAPDPPEGTGTRYYEGTKVTVTALPDPNYKFVRWIENGRPLSCGHTFVCTMDRSKDLTALFEWTPDGAVGGDYYGVKLTFLTSPYLNGYDAMGVDISPPPDSMPRVGVHEYYCLYQLDPGTITMMNPRPSKRFGGWSGSEITLDPGDDSVVKGEPITVHWDGGSTVVPVLKSSGSNPKADMTRVELTVIKYGPGLTRPDVGLHSIPGGPPYTLTAYQDDGAWGVEFKKWQIDYEDDGREAQDKTDPSIQVSTNTDIVAKAWFSPLFPYWVGDRYLRPTPTAMNPLHNAPYVIPNGLETFDPIVTVGDHIYFDLDFACGDGHKISGVKAALVTHGSGVTICDTTKTFSPRERIVLITKSDAYPHGTIEKLEIPDTIDDLSGYKLLVYGRIASKEQRETMQPGRVKLLL